jgi:hypothetical protein
MVLKGAIKKAECGGTPGDALTGDLNPVRRQSA